MTLSIFATYAEDLFAGTTDTLKDHPQIPLIIDTLSRKENHHILLMGMSSEKTQFALLKSVALQLADGHAPKSLRNVNFIYFDAKRLTLANETVDKIYADFAEFCNQISATEQRTLIAINEFSEPLATLIETQLDNDNFRFILLNQLEDHPSFANIFLTEPNDAQLTTLLKSYKKELEDFHHVLIPEETCAAALSLTSHYLSCHSYFDKALELLDSAAARASALEHPDHTSQLKPIVTSTTLTHVVSSWTDIPVSHLHNNTFQSGKFIEALQRRIFGQEAAIDMVGSVLQHACIKLQEKSGPLCNFLFVGPAEAGKTTTAFTLAEHLFGHKNALLRVNLNEPCQSLADIKILTEENHSMPLLTAIQKTPYAIVLIENIHQAPTAILALFKNIFNQGFALDAQGNKYNFRHAIFIISTTLGADHIATLTQTPAHQENNKTLDLMQLVLNTSPHDMNSEMHPHLTTQEICEELAPILEEHFSSSLLEHLHIIPFLPLDYAAYEKIMRLKLKSFAKRLETQFGIELNYAAEVIKYLAHEAVWRKTHTKSLDKLLEQHLYSAVANELLAHAEDKNRTKRLLLQLNDDGQVLRCEFISAMSSMNY